MFPAIASPSRDGSRVPFELFTRADVFDREQEAIFRGPVWNYVALEAELPEPCDFKTSFVGDTPIIVSRAEDGSLHAFVNRCAHRGATVQRQACGNARQHRCVYHQWAYDRAGALVACGGMDRDDGVDPLSCRHPTLRSKRCAVHGQLPRRRPARTACRASIGGRASRRTGRRIRVRKVRLGGRPRGQ